MRHHTFIALLLLISMFAIPIVVFAGFGSTSLMYRPIGGRILDTGTIGRALITCTSAYGPLTMQSVIPAATGPYFIRTALGGTPRPGGYILGLYRQSPSYGTCYNTETDAPVPAYELTMYGVSR